MNAKGSYHLSHLISSLLILYELNSLNFVRTSEATSPTNNRPFDNVQLPMYTGP